MFCQDTLYCFQNLVSLTLKQFLYLRISCYLVLFVSHIAKLFYFQFPFVLFLLQFDTSCYLVHHVPFVLFIYFICFTFQFYLSQLNLLPTILAYHFLQNLDCTLFNLCKGYFLLLPCSTAIPCRRSLLTCNLLDWSINFFWLVLGWKISRFIIVTNPISVGILLLHSGGWLWFQIFTHASQIQFLQILEFSSHLQNSIFIQYFRYFNRSISNATKKSDINRQNINLPRQTNPIQRFLKKYIQLLTLMLNQVKKIKVYRAILKRDVRTLSSMVTFAQIQAGKMKKRTLADNTGGMKPTWNQILEFKTKKKIQLSLFMIRARLVKSQLAKNCFQDKEECIDLLFQQKLIGKLYLKVFATSQSSTLNFPTILSPKKSIQQNERNLFGNVGNNLLNTPPSPNQPTNILDYLNSPPIPSQSIPIMNPYPYSSPPILNGYAPQPGAFNEQTMMSPTYGYNYGPMTNMGQMGYNAIQYSPNREQNRNAQILRARESNGSKKGKVQKQSPFLDDIKVIANKIHNIFL